MNLVNDLFHELKIYTFTFPDIIRDTLSSKREKSYTSGIYDEIISAKDDLLALNPEWNMILDYISTKGTVSVFNSSFEDKYKDVKASILYDPKSALKYLMHNGKKLFYPGNIRNTLLNMYYHSVYSEQDIESPHRYLDAGENLNDTILFDCGCAEANFALDVIDQVKAAYLFEGDQKWFKPLAHTFAPWKDKVRIVRSFVGQEAGQISLRSFIEKLAAQGRLDYENDKVFIKMDIEGAEVSVMEDILPLLNKFKHLRLAVCVYHRADDEKKIREMLPGEYIGRVRNGYMLFLPEIDLPGHKKPEYPYFRHGVMRIERKQ